MLTLQTGFFSYSPLQLELNNAIFHFTVCFELPQLDQPALPASNANKPSSAVPEEPLPDLPPMTILLVEDNAVNRAVATRMLEKLGHRVVAAENGRLALEQIAKQHFDAILMDCQMPELDGYETTRIIRNQELVTNQHMPIIAITAHAMEGDRERCLESGMDEYVTKPINRKELIDKLAAIAKRARVS